MIIDDILYSIAYYPTMAAKQLYRSRNNRVITGLCGGIADYFGWDATLVRIGAVILEFMTASLITIPYLILAIVVPKEPKTTDT